MTQSIVLLLDDDEQFRALVKPVLANKGLDVFEASSAGEANEILRLRKVDLIIVDNILPDSEGLSWITMQRAAGNTTPMIFISAIWQDINVYHQLTKHLGVAQVIHKPVIPSVFGEQVMTELGQRPRWKVTEELVLKPLQGSLKDIADEYVANLPDNIGVVEKSLAQMKKKGEDQLEAYNQARISAHKIRGTAGTFGLQKIGDAMGVVEDILRSVASDIDSLSDDQWLEIENSMRRAKTLLPQSAPSEDELPRHLRMRRISEAHTILSRLLVVDDDEALLSFLTRIGRQRLVDVITAKEPQEALDKLKTARFDAAIIDLQLGQGADSLGLAHAIRELPGYDELPLAFMSSDAAVDDRVSIAHAGASLYLNKPIEPDTFEDAVQRLLALKKIGQSTVLLIDDDEMFCQHVQSVLSDRGLNVHTLGDPALVIEKLNEVNPDLLLLDLLMPGISGFDVCKMVRTIPRWQDLPIIFVTAQVGLETRIAAYECGGDDYLPKPMSDEELVSRVQLRVERAKLLRERTERDSISGLLLRRSFMERMNGLLASGKRHSHGVGLALLDIDYFKQVNDTHGHLAGDSVLAGLGRLMSRRFRVEDLRGRWGGDEFILGFYASDAVQSSRTAQSLVKEFHEMGFPSETGKIFYTSLSVGVSCFPDDGESVYDLIRVADRRLYIAKSTGRNRVVDAEIESAVKTG